MAKTARELNREPPMMKFFRVMGQLFPAWGQKQDEAWESGVALLRRSEATRCASVPVGGAPEL